MSIAEYWAGLRASIIKSWTMRTVLFWTLVQALAENVNLFSAVVDSKHFPFLVAGTIALSRLKGLSADVKARK